LVFVVNCPGHVHTVEVTGSNPVSPTRKTKDYGAIAIILCCAGRIVEKKKKTEKKILTNNLKYYI